MPISTVNAVSQDGGGMISTVFAKAPLFFGAIAVVVISFLLASVLRRTVMNSLAEHNTDDQVAILVGKVTHIGVLILGATIALKIIGIDITSIVGMFGLAFGFALQDIIKNFVCGALLLIQQPFRIGDVIKVGEYVGKVQAIESRSTNIRTFEGQQVIIPNADVFSMSVTNFSAHPERRLELVVGVDYSTDLNKAANIVLNILKSHSDVLQNPAPSVVFTDFDASCINISAKYWIDVTSSLWGIKSAVLREVKDAFDKAGINIPFPIQTLDFKDEKIEELFSKENNPVKTQDLASPESEQTLVRSDMKVEPTQVRSEIKAEQANAVHIPIQAVQQVPAPQVRPATPVFDHAPAVKQEVQEALNQSGEQKSEQTYTSAMNNFQQGVGSMSS